MKYGKIKTLDFYLNELSKRGKVYKENLEISLNIMLTQINDVCNKQKYTSKEYQEIFPASKYLKVLTNYLLKFILLIEMIHQDISK